jgi:hypothetical protein
MPKIKYLDKNFSPDRLATIQLANDIITDYRKQGFVLTLRQLYYKLVSRAIIPNEVRAYNRLGELISDARLAGLVDWHAIEDRTRNVEILANWAAPANILKSAADSYHNDLWRWQPIRPEVWVEKDALEGVIAAACQPLDVPYFSCRGYTSQTAMWDAAQRILGHRRDLVIYDGPHKRKKGQEFRQKTVIFHLGDHDPSGIDMSRDITERLSLFVGRPVDVRRIALNMPQVQTYNPPPNPAKTTDSRFESYLQKYGDESWELDALEPKVIVDLIQKNLYSIMDRARYDEALEIQEQGRKELNAITDHYNLAVKAALKKEN